MAGSKENAGAGNGGGARNRSPRFAELRRELSRQVAAKGETPHRPANREQAVSAAEKLRQTIATPSPAVRPRAKRGA
eukprot:SAG22_NODE_11044_length_503_cov_1.101485_1_plen_76_part_10